MIPVKWVGMSIRNPTAIPVFCKHCGKPLKEGHKRHRYEICNGCKGGRRK